jgi:predicted DNA binding CopG/RHH family protein
MTKSSLKQPIADYKTDEEVAEFWETHSVADYFDKNNLVDLDLSKLKPSTQPVTIRLPKGLVDDIKILANSKDVPYQSYLKIILAEKVQEMQSRRVKVHSHS